MPRTILVCLDESPYSAAAVELGVRWSQRFDCLLVGMGVIDEPSLRGAQPVESLPPSYERAYQQMLSQAEHRVDQILEKFTLRCVEAGVSHKLLEDVGAPCQQIMMEAQRYDLVLLGCKTFFEKPDHPCDTLDKLLHHTPRPVVAVPEGAAPAAAVLVAYDGSLPAARALQAFQGSGLAQLGEVHVLCQHPSSAVEAGKTAQRAVEYLRFHDVPARPHAIASGQSVSQVILGTADEISAGLIVMGAHGRSPMAEFFLGSVTKLILNKSTVPVFLYH